MQENVEQYENHWHEIHVVPNIEKILPIEDRDPDIEKIIPIEDENLTKFD